MQTDGVQRESFDDRVTVVIAQHDAKLRTIVSAVLEGEDDICVVGKCASGDEAVAMALELLPDVVLVELDLPGIDGIDVCRQIKAEAPIVRVLLTCGDATDESYAAIAAGSSGCFSRSEAQARITDAVRGAARSEVVVPAKWAGQLLADLEAVTARRNPLAPAIQLTTTEREVLQRLAQGESPIDIADDHDVTERLVNLHTGYAVTKLQRSQALQLSFAHTT